MGRWGVPGSEKQRGSQMSSFEFMINDRRYSVDVQEVDERRASVVVNGVSYDVNLVEREQDAVAAPAGLARAVPPAAPAVPVAQPRIPRGTEVRAPMPGLVLEVKVKPGDRVTAGETVVCMEAMKMKNMLSASEDGVVKEVLVEDGSQVREGTLLLVIE